MGRLKVDNSESKIIKNTLLDSYYDECCVLGCNIISTYYEAITKGHRTKMIRNGTVLLEFGSTSRNNYTKLKIFIRSDNNYTRDKVYGYVDRVEVLSEDGVNIKNEVDGLFIRQLIEGTIR